MYVAGLYGREGDSLNLIPQISKSMVSVSLEDVGCHLAGTSHSRTLILHSRDSVEGRDDLE